MNFDLLRTWMSLPPGDWPPEPHVLLGLSPGSTVPVQDRALALMERLRPHQLRHPELVTEGMNRLAQALVAIEQKSKPPGIAFEFDAAPQAPQAAQVVLDAESVPNAFPVVEAIAAPKPVKRRRKRSMPPAPVVAAAVAAVDVAEPTADRREAYRRLASVRAIRRSWLLLGPIYGVPSHSLITSGDVLSYLVAVRDNHKSLSQLSAWTNPYGLLVRRIVADPATLSLFRDLRKSQRDALALDWAQASESWRAHEASLRNRMARTKPPPTLQRRLRSLRNRGRRHPEWLLGLAVTVLILATLLRTNAF